MWNFKGYLWNSTQNIIPIHWKIQFVYNFEILGDFRFKSSCAFFKWPLIWWWEWWRSCGYDIWCLPCMAPGVAGRRHAATGIFLGLPRQQSSWGQHGAHLGLVSSRWAPCWPHEPCCQGTIVAFLWSHCNSFVSLRLTDAYICVTKLGHHWFR